MVQVDWCSAASRCSRKLKKAAVALEDRKLSWTVDLGAERSEILLAKATFRQLL